MKTYKNSSLRKYNTFGLSHKANVIIEVENESDIQDLDPQLLSNLYLIIGSGSNLLFTQDFNGTILKINLFGKTVIDEDDSDVTLSVKAGEIWHDFVEWTVDNGYYGLENLALIPGTVGASPVQNIGAYGKEVREFVEKVKVFDLKTQSWIWMSNEECEFEYRNSYLKRNIGRYIVSEVVFRLSKFPNLNLSYGGLKQKLIDNNITSPSPKDVLSAVIDIRNSKLPNPSEIGNAGSFFKNPIVDRNTCTQLLETYPNLVHYKVSETLEKLAAGWLIEQAGWKGKTYDGYGVYDKQSLIIVNYHLEEGDKLKQLSEDIQYSVKDKFGIVLEPEVQMF